MRERRNRWRALAALALLCAAPRPAEAQFGEFMEDKTRALRDFFRGPPPPRAPHGLRACGSLYGEEARSIVRRRDLLDSTTQWLRESYAVISSLGPLPLCFAYRYDTLTTNEGRRLLQVNQFFLRQQRVQSYLLTAYVDPAERDSALARRRAGNVRLRSPLPECRYRTRWRNTGDDWYSRKVYYDPLPPAPPRCQTPPHP